jgi:hypothetical protein
MWMRRLGPRIAEKIVGEAEQSAQSFGWRIEHMFARLGGGPDGTFTPVPNRRKLGVRSCLMSLPETGKVP